MASRWEVEEEESARSLARTPRREFGKCIDLDFNLLPTPRGATRRWTTLFSYCEIHEGAKIVF